MEALQAHQWPGLNRKAPPAVGRVLHAADAQQPHGQLADDLSDSRPTSGDPHGAPAAADAPAENGFLQGSDVLALREFLASDDAAADALPLDEADESEGRFDQLMAAVAGQPPYVMTIRVFLTTAAYSHTSGGSWCMRIAKRPTCLRRKQTAAPAAARLAAAPGGGEHGAADDGGFRTG